MLSPGIAISAQSNGDRVVDGADLLTSYEESRLESMLADWCDENEFDIVIVTNYNGLSQDGANRELVNYADAYYDRNGYGYGDNRDGCILVIDMGSREYYISTSGYGITALTDYGIDRLGDEMREDLGEGDYYDAIEDGFIENVQWMLGRARDGEPYDVRSDKPSISEPSVLSGMLTISLGIGVVVGLVLAMLKKNQLKTVRRRIEAQNYVVPGSMRITKNYDRFMYSNIVATPRADSDNNHHGGSTTHMSPSGGMHGGGGGRF